MTHATDDTPLVAEAIAARTAADPDAVAVLTDDDMLTYGQLLAQATRVARAVREAGAGRDQVVGLSCRRSTDGLAGLLGILLAGAGYTYLDPAWPPDRLRRVVAQCWMPILVADPHAADLAEDLGPATVGLDRVFTAPADGDPDPVAVSEPRDLAYVVYTSGSTGVPKGVAVEHAGVSNMAHQLARLFRVAPGERMVQFAHWAWDAAVCEILVTLTAGGTLVLAPETVRRGGDDLAAFLRRHRVSVATLTPSVLAALPDRDLPDLRTVVAVGEPCPPHLVTRWAQPGRRFLNGYGPSEATVAVSVGVCRPGHPVTIGRALPGVRVRVVDDTGTAVPVGQPGELLVGGVGVARGYLTDPEDAHPDLGPTVRTGGPFFADADGRWYRTGDIVRQRVDGSLVFVDRLDDQIQLHGHRIEPSEVGTALKTHPAVRACVVMPVGGRLVAWVEVTDASVSAADLAATAADRLPSHMVPEIRLVEQWPLTDQGKLDRAMLRAAPTADNPQPRTGPAESKGPAESVGRAVLDEVRLVLDDDTVGVDDDFFDIGGHSLLAAELAVRLTERFGVPVEARQVAEHRTAGRLATLVEQRALVGQAR